MITFTIVIQETSQGVQFTVSTPAGRATPAEFKLGVEFQELINQFGAKSSVVSKSFTDANRKTLNSIKEN
jgi:hypothetical protein